MANNKIIYTTGDTWMKLALLFAILSISTLNTVSAAETENDSTENASYCNEQAQLAGIEDAAEKAEYINDCMASFGTPTDDNR
jgi:hypothetical protein